MNTFYTSLKSRLFFALGLFGLLVFTSCGSSYYGAEAAGDGIYANTTDSEPEVAEETQTDKSNYYKQYFQSKDKAYEEIPEDGAVFTDIEAYHTKESLDEEGNIIIEEQYYDQGYGAWGTNGGNVSVNVKVEKKNDEDNSEWNFDPVTFSHIVLNGDDPVGKNAAIVVETLLKEVDT